MLSRIRTPSQRDITEIDVQPAAVTGRVTDDLPSTHDRATLDIHPTTTIPKGTRSGGVLENPYLVQCQVSAPDQHSAALVAGRVADDLALAQGHTATCDEHPTAKAIRPVSAIGDVVADDDLAQREIGIPAIDTAPTGRDVTTRQAQPLNSRTDASNDKENTPLPPSIQSSGKEAGSDVPQSTTE